MASGSVITNAKQFSLGLDRSVEKVFVKFRVRVKMLMDEGMRRMIARTPVHTGQAVLNYVASSGAPYSGGVKQGYDAQKGTNRMELGSEKHRSAASRVSLATLKSVSVDDPFKTHYITNRSPNIIALEHGEPPQKGMRARSPAGMAGVTLQELLLLLQSGKV